MRATARPCGRRAWSSCWPGCTPPTASRAPPSTGESCTRLEAREMTPLSTYEERLRRDPRWALLEGSMHFDKGNQVFRTLQRITDRLDQLGVGYALADGLALFHHGY